MASISRQTTITQLQNFNKKVYSINDDRNFTLSGMLSNIQRFAMRALKGIRKKDKEKTKRNLLISLSWFIGTLNQLHIVIEGEVWKRFPYVCSYCGRLPCSCQKNKFSQRQKVSPDENKRPKTLEDYQKMFAKIYPPQKRNLEHAGIHLAEELGELSEAILIFRGSHQKEDFEKVILEAADFFSCVMGVFNSLDVKCALELSKIFYNNCHICHKAPCQCDFSFISNFKS